MTSHCTFPFAALLALLCLWLAPCVAEEEPDEEPAPPPPAGVLQIQGQGKIQIKGGGIIQLQGGNLQIKGDDIIRAQMANAALAANADPNAENPSWLGIQMEVRGNLDLDEDELPPPGVGVVAVVEAGPAAKAGLKAFDRVLKIEEKELKDEQDLRTTVRATKPGTTITLRVLREGKEQDLKVELEAMPAQANMGLLQGFNFNTNSKPDKIHFFNLPVSTSETIGLDVVVLRDGNRLEGKLIALTEREATLRLASGPEVVLELASVQAIRWLGGARPKSLPATLILTDGSSLAGSDLSYQDGKFTLNLENQMMIHLPRDQVSEAALSATEAPNFYRGPIANDGWKSFPLKSWKFAEQAWTQAEAQSAVLSRKFADLPPALELEFDYESTSNSFEVLLFGQRLENRGLSSPGIVQIRWSQDLLNVGQFDGQRFFNLEALLKLPQPENPKAVVHHFHIFANRLTGRLGIYRNDTLLGEYEMGTVAPEDLPRAGRVVQVSATGTSKISNIRIRPWTGPLPHPPTKLPLANDQLTMDTQDPRTGTLTSLTNTEVTFAGQAASPRKLPLSLRLKPSAQAVALASRIHIETKQGSAFSANSVRLTDKTLTAATSFAGDVAIPLINLRLLEFRDANPMTPPKPDQLDVLTFVDGKQLTGRFAPPFIEGKVAWVLSAAKSPLLIELDRIKSLLLAPKSEPLTAPTQVLRLHNGDWFPAEVLAIDTTTLTVRTAFAPAWKLPRSDIATIYSPPSAKIVSDGASGRKRWRETATTSGNTATFTDDDTMPQQTYLYADGSYRMRLANTSDNSAGGLAMPIPVEANDGATVEFTIGGVLNWTIFTLMDARGEGAFSIYASGDMMRVTRIHSAMNMQNRKMDQFQFAIPEKLVSSEVGQRYQLVLDRGNTSLHLALNGQKLGTVKLKAEDPWTEITKLVFYPTTFGNINFKLSDVWIAPWNGTFGPASGTTADQVALAFVNGDDARGKLLSLNHAEAEIDTESAGPMTLPLPRVRSIDFAGQPVLRQDAYRLHLYDRGQLSGSALAFSDHSATLTTAHGPVTLPVAMVKEIIFAERAPN